MVRLVLSHGADVAAVSADGKTALKIASANKRPEVVAVLSKFILWRKL